MKEAFSKLFWGFLFVFIEIHIIAFDILPDPLGYFFIYLGLEKIGTEYGVRNKSRLFATLMFALSLPTVVFQQPNGFMGLSVNDGWNLYYSGLGIGKLILVFYVFKIMVVLAQISGDEAILRHTEKVFKVYMITMLSVTCIQPFLMNMSKDLVTGIGLVMIAATLIMEITLLVLLRKFRRVDIGLVDETGRNVDLSV